MRCVWKDLTVFCAPNGLTAQADRLYRNLGDGRFVAVSFRSGIQRLEPSAGFTVVSFDFDDDGDPDLYVANDSVPNHLFVNDGHGRFTEQAIPLGAAVSESGQAQASMGLDIADYDGDGHLDVVFSYFDRDYNTLLRNIDGRAFNDSSFAAGIARASMPLSTCFVERTSASRAMVSSSCSPGSSCARRADSRSHWRSSRPPSGSLQAARRSPSSVA